MTVVAVAGDCTTTTCVALAAAWYAGDEVIILEADPSGGSLAGWLDTPSSPSLASAVAATTAANRSAADTIDSVVQRSRSGLRFIAAPVRSLPASRAIAEASATIIPELSLRRDVVVLADLGRPAGERSPLLDAATVIVIAHRQSPTSAAAESVRLERLLEHVEHLAATGAPLVLAVIGRDPFDPDEVVRFVDDSVPGATSDVCRLADDPLAAAVLAGRAGVSARRLMRLPLMRSAADAAGRLRPHLIAPARPSAWLTTDRLNSEARP